jgi:hypothetical protein
MPPLNLIGKRYGKLTVVERTHSTKSGESVWICLCDCGKSTTVTGSNLTTENTKSCGCLRIEKSIKTAKERVMTHGMSNTITYCSWASMKERCLNPNSKDFKYYGGRGITICPRWLNSFIKFL